MTTARCPICRAGILERIERDLGFGDEVVIRSEAYQCSTCRESVLDAAQVEQLRKAIRDRALAEDETEVDAVLERLIMRPE